MSSFWRPWKRREHAWWLLLPLLALGGISAVVAKAGGPLWLTIGLAALGAVGTGALAYSKESAKARDGSEDIRRRSMRTSAANSMNAPVSKDMLFSDWGVHASTVEVPYLERDAEVDVIAVLEQQKPVLVLGASMAGKTRMAAKLVQELYPNRQVVVPDVPDGLATMMNAGEAPHDCVVWLDDLERYLTDPKNLKTKWIVDLTSAGNILLATMRESLYEGFQPKDDEPRTQWETLSQFQKVHLTNNVEERHRLAATGVPARVGEGIVKYGLGTYVGGGHLALERMASGRATNPVGVALVLAAIDWQRSGIAEAAPKAVLVRLWSEYVDDFDLDRSADAIDGGLSWATARMGGGAFRLLVPVGEELLPFDYLVDHTAAAGTRIPNAVWNAVAEAEAAPGRLNHSGKVAIYQGQDDAAARLFERAAGAEDPEGMANWATTLERRDQISNAEDLHRKAAAVGDSRGKTGLGVLLLREGRMEEAEELFREAASAGEGDAMANLGYIQMHRGETTEAREWYRRATNAGSGLGMTNYGMQLAKAGRHDDAEKLYIAAVSRRNGAGMYELAKVRSSQGRHEEANHLISLAVDHGNPAAMSAMGLAILGKDLAEAERLFARAAKRDDAVGLIELGKILAGRGEPDEAKKLFWRAVEKGEAQGNHCLGVIFAGAGEIPEAKDHYQVGVAHGIDQSMINLGELLWLEGHRAEAETLFRRASEMGNPEAMGWLANALQDKGETAEAEAWLQRSNSSDAPD